MLLLFSYSVMSNSLDPVNCSPPSSSVHGILQARILEWVAIFFSKGNFLLQEEVSLTGKFILIINDTNMNKIEHLR